MLGKTAANAGEVERQAVHRQRGRVRKRRGYASRMRPRSALQADERKVRLSDNPAARALVEHRGNFADMDKFLLMEGFFTAFAACRGIEAGQR